MLPLLEPQPHPNRRECLRLGGLSAFGLSLSGLLANAATRTTGRAKACIVLFHLGGPPQHETWDPKPDAPVEIRGPFAPIATNVPGIRVCELMPRTASMMDRICVFRALSTNDNAHSSSGYWMLTGQPHQPTNSENAKPGAPNDWPSLSAIWQHLKGRAGGVPASVQIPEHIWNDGGISWPGQDAGFLGRASDPWLLQCEPNQPAFGVPGLTLPAEVAPRFGERVGLLDQYNRHLGNLEGSRATDRFDVWNRQALDMLRSNSARRAFHLDDEPDRVRERYGRNRWGQSCLLARRLVEAGVSLVQVNWTRMANIDTGGSPAWDTHAKNAEKCKNALLPIGDQAYSALLDDLATRGLLEDTLVVWMGEFGRTPKHNGGGGRDHWGHVFSATLAGGGVRGGQVIGSSDGQGAYPREGIVRPQDFQATILHALGYPADTEMHDTLGRPLPISRGSVVRGVF